jgi:hypothetical protein
LIDLKIKKGINMSQAALTPKTELPIVEITKIKVTGELIQISCTNPENNQAIFPVEAKIAVNKTGYLEALDQLLTQALIGGYAVCMSPQMKQAFLKLIPDNSPEKEAVRLNLAQLRSPQAYQANVEAQTITRESYKPITVKTKKQLQTILDSKIITLVSGFSESKDDKKEEKQTEEKEDKELLVHFGTALAGLDYGTSSFFNFIRRADPNKVLVAVAIRTLGNLMMAGRCRLPLSEVLKVIDMMTQVVANKKEQKSFEPALVAALVKAMTFIFDADQKAEQLTHKLAVQVCKNILLTLHTEDEQADGLLQKAQGYLSQVAKMEEERAKRAREATAKQEIALTDLTTRSMSSSAVATSTSVGNSSVMATVTNSSTQLTTTQPLGSSSSASATISMSSATMLATSMTRAGGVFNQDHNTVEMHEIATTAASQQTKTNSSINS